MADASRSGLARAGAPGWHWAAVLPLLLTFAAPAAALVGTTLRDLADPVPPGGILTYNIRLSNQGGFPVSCFNPPPGCQLTTSGCTSSSPECVGDSFVGFICENSGNNGANCGVGDPPIADARLCTPRTGCTGTTFACVRAYNEGASCAVGTPPEPNVQLCIQNPSGICSGGPNFGLTCTSPHRQPTEQCPPDPEAPTGITVALPIPAGTSFLDATSGGTSDGTRITWSVPPLIACGSAGTPQCPQVSARLTVDTLTPIGTVIQAISTATDAQGSTTSPLERTTVGTFRLQSFILVYPPRPDHDKVIYKTLFTLGPTQTIDPFNEAFRLVVTNSAGTIVDLSLPPQSFLPSSSTSFLYSSRDPGLNIVSLRQLASGHYALSLKASRLALPELFTNLAVVADLTFGDDVLSQQIQLFTRRGGKRFTAGR
jgi:hypothetical protein